VKLMYAVAALATAGAAVVTAAALRPTPAPEPVRHPVTMTIPAVPGSLDGAYEPGITRSWQPVASFGNATGTTPRVAVYYSGWGEAFNSALAAQAQQHRARVLVQMNPGGASLAAVAAGKSDAYLRSYADAVRASGHPVIIGFGHEMNGGWYQWGAGHTAPSVFVAAWRHVVDVFRGQGALNVTWLWTVNAVNATSAPMSQWWPGAAYVTWVGIDGYYYHPADTFSWVFGRTLTRLREFTADPVLISETAVAPNPDAAQQVRGLFAGAAADHVLGVVWFDQSEHKPPYHLAWRVETDPAALAAFRAAASR